MDDLWDKFTGVLTFVLIGIPILGLLLIVLLYVFSYVLLPIFVTGSVVGLLFGTFYGMKNCILSINENISNNVLKYTMIVIASLFIILMVMYLIATAYFLSGFLN